MQRQYSSVEQRVTLGALMVVFLLGAMDNVIVSTALPRIMEQLKGIELYAWVGTIYLLTSTVLVPIYGKLGDLYGRKSLLIIAIVIFLVGSALCGLAGEFGDLPLIGGGMAQLVLFRAIQGIGGGGLFSSGFAIVAEMFSPRERAKYMGLMGAMFGLASIIGPAIGGFFTDLGMTSLFGHEIAGWRYVFYVNLPLGLIALGLIAYEMPQLANDASGKVDYLGAVLVVTTFVPMLLAFTEVGHGHAWGDPQIIGLLLGSLLSLILFIWAEARTPDAIVPLELFRIRAFSVTNTAGFVIGMAFFGIIMFVPLFLQTVQGMSATNSGFTMLAFMVGMLLGASGSGNLASRMGKTKIFIVIGGVLLLLGIFSLSRLRPDASTFDVGWRLFLVGLGIGPTQSIFTIIVQNAVDKRHLGIATSSTQFFRQIGATIGIAMFGSLLTHNLNTALAADVPDWSGRGAVTVNLDEAQAHAMNPAQIAAPIAAAYAQRLASLEQAYRGDAAAAQSALTDPLLPDQVKSDLRSFQSNPTQSSEQLLATAHTQLDAASKQLAQRVQTGTRQAFSTAITALFSASLWIVGVGFLLILAIPELPMVDRRGQPAPVSEGM